MGIVFEGVCYADIHEAALSACSGFTGITDAGASTCTAGVSAGPGFCQEYQCDENGCVCIVEGPTVYGIQRTINTTPLNGGESNQVQAVLGEQGPCQYTAGFEYWGPILAAFFIAGVSLIAARVLYRMFNRETFGA